VIIKYLIRILGLTTGNIKCSIYFLLFSIPSITGSLAFGQSNKIIEISTPITLQKISALPSIINEASGLEISQNKILWTHNDGGLPILYGLDTLGKIVQTIQLNHNNNGWEDLCQDEKGNFFVGNFGNNFNARKDLKIFKIPNPETIKEPIINGETIHFSYSDQKSYPPSNSQKNFDMDAMICLRDSLLLFSKNRTNPFSGYTKIYFLSTQPGEQIAMPIDSIFLGKKYGMMSYWVTGADISPNKNVIALLSHDCIWLITHFSAKRISQGNIFRVPLNHFSHKAGICFISDTKIYFVDELELGILGGNLYSIDLTAVFFEIKKVTTD
jgi:hypothetical protein